MIKWNQHKQRYQYYDRNGYEITEGMYILIDGAYRLIYATEDGLGTDATNPSWLKSGKAEPCQYGIYGLTTLETEECDFYEYDARYEVGGLVERLINVADRNIVENFADVETDENWVKMAEEKEKQMEQEKEYRIAYSDIAYIRNLLYDVAKVSDELEGVISTEEVFDAINRLCTLKEV